jgi:hypothetical protein
MIDNQLGRRNLSEAQIKLLRGRRYNLEKQAVGANQHTRKSLPQIEGATAETATRLADQYRVSKATIER